MSRSLLDHPTVYGARAKLGIIVPPTNTANEAEWNRMAPAGVSVHATRMPLHLDTSSAAGREALLRDVEHHAHLLAQASVNVIAYGCTAGSMVSPVTALGDFMREATGVAALSTAEAIIAALRALRIERVAVATPYHQALNDHEAHFLASHGVEVCTIEGLGYGAGGVQEYRNIARIDAPAVQALARSVDSHRAQAVLISCTDLATLDSIPMLEAELGKPVVSSNTATFWATLRAAGLNDALPGCGALLTTGRMSGS